MEHENTLFHITDSSIFLIKSCGYVESLSHW